MTPKPNSVNNPRLVEGLFAALPGQPSLLFWDPEQDIAVSICPTPQVGLIPQFPDRLNYVAVMVAPITLKDIFTKDYATEWLEIAINSMNLSALVDGMDPESEMEYALAVTPEAEVLDTTISYRGVICVPVLERILRMNINLARMQAAAAERIDSIVFAPQPAATETH